MTRSPFSIIAKSAIARPTWRCRRFFSLAISTGSLRRGAASRPLGRRRRQRRWRKRKARPRFLQCGGARGLGRQQCIGGSRATDRRGHRPRRRLDPVQPLHGARALRARASATTRAGGRSSAAMPGVGQRLRHRARAVAAVRPGAGAPGRAGARRERQRRGLGVRRRQRRARGASCSARSAIACAAIRSSSCRRRCASASATRRARSAIAFAGSTRCRERCAASSSPTRCSTRCRSTCSTSTASPGASAAWSSRRERRRVRMGRSPTTANGRRWRGVPRRQHDRAARAGAGVRRHARRPPRARRDLPRSTTAFPRPSTTTRSAPAAR